MNKHTAHRLLDGVRRGAQFTEAEITAALEATGDISEKSWHISDEDDSAQMALPIEPEALSDYPTQRRAAAGTWERKAPNAGLLAAATWCGV